MSLIIQKENNYENYGMNAAEKEETKANKQEKSGGRKKE